MQIIEKNLSDLKPAEYNPRYIDDESFVGLTKSIKKFGYLEPIIWNKRTGNIVGGHQRYKVLKEQKQKTAKVVVVDLSLEEERVLNLTLNNRHIQGDWTANLEVILDDIKTDDQELYADLNLDFLIDDIPEIPEPEIIGNTDPDVVPEVPKEPVIKTGDLITLGKHRILCADSTKKEDVERVMGGEKIDCAIVDPPYGVAYADKNTFLNSIDKGNSCQKKIKEDHGSTKETAAFWALLFKNISDYLADYSSYYIFGPQGGDLALMMMMMMNENGLPLHHTIIWAKNNHVLGRCDYNYKHEPILFGWKSRHKFYGNGQFKTSVWEVNKPLKNDLHPTMKPVELIVNAILNSSKQGMLIADFCLGAGAVLIACEQTNRQCKGIEIDCSYIQVCIQRWIDFTDRPEDVTVERGGKEYKWEELNEKREE